MAIRAKNDALTSSTATSSPNKSATLAHPENTDSPVATSEINVSRPGWFARWCQSILVQVISAGPLPKHVGVVMDGNRRYARKQHIETRTGHNAGFEAMQKILEFSYAVGIEEVTVYAFSIENFNRPQQEIDHLMDLARKRLQTLSENGGLADRYGVRIRFLGNISLLPEDVQAVAKSVTERTKNNCRATLNLCMPYTARDDIVHSLSKIAAEHPFNITADTISSHMYTGSCHPLDLLIRTSDTHRFSDFLLWETEMPRTQIDFVSRLWPEYTPWEYFKTLLWWSFGSR